jgi:hypothetical protein
MSQRLAKSGVNLVRIHMARGDGPPTRFVDTVQYMVHAFKQQGIYSYLSWYCTANYGDWTNRLYFDPEVQQEYRAWTRTILSSPNPYTGLTLAQDPAVAAVELIDEDSQFFWTFNPQRDGLKQRMPILQARFGDWLKGRYGSLERAAEAWGPEKYPKGDDFAAGRVAIYPAGTLGGADWAVAERNAKRASDHARFMTELMRGWYGDMKAWLREELGYDGLVVGSNWITADERVLPNGTAVQTDVGMTGPYDGVIGVQKELILQRFLTNMPSRFEPASGDVRLCGALIECDQQTGRAQSIQRLMIRECELSNR